MALTTTDSSANPRAFSVGPLKIQIVKLTALSGDTTGTITADTMYRLQHIIAPSAMVFTAAKTYSGNVATLAFTVPAETAASKVTQGLTLTAVANLGAGGNAITIAFTAGAVAGSEVVTVTGNAISVQISTGVSTVTQVRTAMQAAAACTALVTTTGTSSSTVATASALPLLGGVTGGIFCDCLCLGY